MDVDVGDLKAFEQLAAAFLFRQHIILFSFCNIVEVYVACVLLEERADIFELVAGHGLFVFGLLLDLFSLLVGNLFDFGLLLRLFLDVVQLVVLLGVHFLVSQQVLDPFEREVVLRLLLQLRDVRGYVVLTDVGVAVHQL